MLQVGFCIWNHGIVFSLNMQAFHAFLEQFVSPSVFGSLVVGLVFFPLKG